MPVVASFYPLYFFSREIGGDAADVVNITPAGAEPHDYEPTPGDIVRIEESRLLVLNGGGLEAWGERISKTVDPKRTTVVVAGEGLATATTEEDGTVIPDPHIWLSPLLANRMADRIAEGFATADPSHADQYRANARVLKHTLDDLDREYRQGFRSCTQTTIVTAHAAFGYLAAAYGLKQIAITGISPDAEPSPQRMAAIAKFAKENKVRFIFFESLVSPKLAETIAREVGATTLVLNPIEGFTDDEIAAGKNYFTEMRQNLHNLQLALQCEP